MGGPFLAFGLLVGVFAFGLGILIDLLGRSAAEVVAWSLIGGLLLGAVTLFLLETFVFGDGPFTRLLNKNIGTTRPDVVRRETSDPDDDPVDWD
jgi:hypothetical protein